MIVWFLALNISSSLGGISIVDWLKASLLRPPLSSKSVNRCLATLLTALLRIMTNLAVRLFILRLIDTTFSQVRTSAELTHHLCSAVCLPMSCAVDMVKCAQAPVTTASLHASIATSTPASELVSLKLLAWLLLLLPLLIMLEVLLRLIRWFVEILVAVIVIALTAIILDALGISVGTLIPIILATGHILTIITTSIGIATSASLSSSSSLSSSPIVGTVTNMVDLLSCWL